MSCLLEDGTQRPSMHNVVGMLESVLQLQDGVVNGVMESGECSHDSKESCRMIHEHASSMMNVFSEIKDPKGR
ncbi:hypothetical protein Fmac_017402 [Flemingia macrophylla]|uniref:Uncharacterized protein n=1 Tax=Flemingia macrophylla TaxID=520843 RepID=A0ABD1M267_9FABA